MVRGSKMRASGTMQDRINEHKGVEIHYNIGVTDVTGDAKGVNGLQLRHTESGDPFPQPPPQSLSLSFPFKVLLAYRRIPFPVCICPGNHFESPDHCTS